ncbi:CBL-interacting serine/threonine-protein kinase 20-like [Neltuma alba]|uniref:CBL-interacting serine/threonine-protein kinase 20-like n=1 Tax=Neltuma alba TaxID=207710 RepID=UPI0010A35A40|nr:CBL-interacting serine/threonine-protein kinase 20-like [Prosopis alba]
MEKQGKILMQKYELGRLVGQGSFAKVYRARNLKTGKIVAMKVIDKEKVAKIGLNDQIEREISVMRMVKHPNIVQLYEVLASKTKIYFAMEYVKGGELFAKVVKGKLKEDLARRYFQQLIGAVDFCHSRGVYHRDLKLENLLLDENGDLKVSDFGLSALWESRKTDGLLHTMCGTPSYVAPEVINNRGYDGAKADIWSCGVILFVLLAGFLPFQDKNLIAMYMKISKAEFACPLWFPPEVRQLLSRILDPDPRRRVTISKIKQTPWFRKGYNQIEAPLLLQSPSWNNELKAKNEAERSMKPPSLNAFDIISLSSGFDLSPMFEKDKIPRHEARFITTKEASTIVSKLEEIAQADSKFKVLKKNGIVSLHGNKVGRKGQLGIDAEIFEVTSSFHIVEVKKTAGDTLEYVEFRDRNLKPCLKDIGCEWRGSEHDG